MAIDGLTTFLWFDDRAGEAAEFYVATLPDSRLGDISYYGPNAPMPEGTVLTVAFELFSQPFVALNGGPGHPHTDAVSFMVHCDTQEEIDQIWDALIADGGAGIACGWCQDRFGVRWQVVPRVVGELLSGPDPEAAQRAFQAMMGMVKIEIAGLR
jgi:predicted 3-demethylubiquinone-9 3-methyltransferase (glyoxalase superfamily)